MKEKYKTIITDKGLAYNVPTTTLYVTKDCYLFSEDKYGTLKPKIVSDRKTRAEFSYKCSAYVLSHLMIMMFEPENYSIFLNGDHTLKYKNGNYMDCRLHNIFIREVTKNNRIYSGSKRQPKKHILDRIEDSLERYEKIKRNQRRAFAQKKDKKDYSVFTTPKGTYKLKVGSQVIAEHHDRKELIKLGEKSKDLNNTHLLNLGKQLTTKLKLPKLTPMKMDSWN